MIVYLQFAHLAKHCANKMTLPECCLAGLMIIRRCRWSNVSFIITKQLLPEIDDDVKSTRSMIEILEQLSPGFFIQYISYKCFALILIDI